MAPNTTSSSANGDAPDSGSGGESNGYLSSLLGRKVNLGENDVPGAAPSVAPLLALTLDDDPIHKVLVRDNYQGGQDGDGSSGGVGGGSTSFNPQPKRIAHLQFGTLSDTEISRMSEFNVTSRELFSMPSRAPAPGGCLDPRLGISDKVSSCHTCGRKLADCAGHFGHIKLALPVFHIGFFKHTLAILQAICKECSRVLLAEPERIKYLKKMRHPRTDVLARAAMLKKVVAACKKNYVCPHCHRLNGVVKKIAGVTTLKIVHERYTGRRMEDELEGLLELTHDAARTNQDLANLVTPPANSAARGPRGGGGGGGAAPSVVEDLLPSRVLELFRAIPDDDCEVIWTDPTVGRPENLIIQSVLVPPVPIRPSVSMDTPGGGSNEDDLTVKLQEIIDVNVALGIGLAAGQPSRNVMETWDFLQVQVAQYINGEMPGIAKPMGSAAVRPIRGLCQRLKGKQGRFRGNLSGKRVDFSARTVISPDPNLGINQLGVPMRVAKIMTYPEKVNRYNIDKLRKLIRNGPDVHPGANLIRMAGEGSFAKSLAYGNRERAAEGLRVGDTVERHMEDGDVVLFNRQPSLHRVSIMSHFAKIMEWRTFRFNIQVCAPYNADFDGDEMNLHLPQTEEARAEAGSLMNVTNNLITPRNGEPLVAASQDFLSTSYLLTQRDIFFNWNEFSRLISYFSLAEEEVIVPTPAIIRPLPLWTGKQVFSVIVKPNDVSSKEMVSLEMKEKNYDGKKAMKHFCPNDGWVAFRNSELISGNVAKKTIGDGSKTGLLYVLLRDHGPEAATRVMNRFSRLCSRFFGMHKGFSIGISDVTPSPEMQAMKDHILSTGFRQSKKTITSYDEGTLELRPGCDLLQSLEEILNGVLGKLRESAGQEAMRTLPWSNTPRIMAECGSKGSPLNISQMMACVGQQAVGGDRIQDGFVHRTLPHFEYHSLTPSAKGFVANSFYSGLTATEFFFHTMGGREGLVDTAVKTAETGYMARRLMKALEDLSFHYDSTVRNSENTVVQFSYGNDDLNPALMENNDRPVDFDRLHLHVSQMNPCPDEPSMSPDEVRIMVDEILKTEAFRILLPKGIEFHNEINIHFEKCAKLYEELLGDSPNITHKSKEQRIWNRCRFTKTQVKLIMTNAYAKYTKALVEPGEAVGATGAQSISEPGTQMTLKTFHFAGVSSMNVTLGVPRLKEIINASKLISTPIITAKLVKDDNKVGARVVKGVIEKTTLGELAEYIKEVYGSGKSYLSVKLNMKSIEQLRLSVDAVSVRNSILRGSPGQTRPAILRFLKESHVLIKRGSRSKLRIIIPDSTSANIPPVYFYMQALKTQLPLVIVQGIPSINRAVINEEEGPNGKPSFHLLIEGYGLAEVMGAPGVNGLHTTTNHLIEVEATLGVEAARTQIKSEISYIMNAYGIGIDPRHLMLLSDIMTFKGELTINIMCKTRCFWFVTPKLYALYISCIYSF